MPNFDLNSDLGDLKKSSMDLKKITFLAISALQESSTNLLNDEIGIGHSKIKLVSELEKSTITNRQKQSFYNIKYGSSVITSKVSQKISVMKT